MIELPTQDSTAFQDILSVLRSHPELKKWTMIDVKLKFISIEPKVGVNHGGTVLMKELLDFREKGYLSFTDDTSPNFLGYDLTPREFMETDPLQEEENEQQFGGMQL